LCCRRTFPRRRTLADFYYAFGTRTARWPLELSARRDIPVRFLWSVPADVLESPGKSRLGKDKKAIPVLRLDDTTPTPASVVRPLLSPAFACPHHAANVFSVGMDSAADRLHWAREAPLPSPGDTCIDLAPKFAALWKRAMQLRRTIKSRLQEAVDKTPATSYDTLAYRRIRGQSTQQKEALRKAVNEIELAKRAGLRKIFDDLCVAAGQNDFLT
jgi:hypothetical protein